MSCVFIRGKENWTEHVERLEEYRKTKIAPHCLQVTRAAEIHPPERLKYTEWRALTVKSNRELTENKRFSPYRAVNTLRLGYKNQLVNAV
jgi:hypothetical protein